MTTVADLDDRQQDFLKAVRRIDEPDTEDLEDELGIGHQTILSYASRIRKELDDPDILVFAGSCYRLGADYRDKVDKLTEDEDTDDLGELNDREEFILKELPATTEDLQDELGVSELVVEAHMESIGEKGYHIEYDERTDTWHSEESHHLRSSEHIGQRTRAANEWWQKRHDELVKDFRALETPEAEEHSETASQDVVSHLTDLRMGDLVYDENGEEAYNTEITQNVIEYITEKQVELYDLQSQHIEFGTWHELWGGDFLTNEAIYQGQWEDLDAFLDEQHDAIVEPLLKRIKTISEKAETVNIVCVTGNHGEHRASGKSHQANADLILYKHMWNTIATLQDHAGLLENVSMSIAQGRKSNNFELRGGELKGHLRHGDDRKPGYRTSAEQSQWRQTLLSHEFDIGYMGHVHRGQRIDVNGNPVFVTGTPKPSGEFAERIAAGDDDNIALLHGVSDEGLTWCYRIDFRDFDTPTEGDL